MENPQKREDKVENSKSKIDNIIESSVDFIFSKSESRWLILIVLLGVILRFLLIRNIATLGDEMVHGPHAIGFLHSGLISTILHSPTWFYLTDISTRIFGVTLFSLRFTSFFYGTLTIIVVYLLASKIFNKKTGLISAFLLSISFFTVRYTLAEMDISATFFLVFAIYLFLESMEKQKFPTLAAISLGVAALIKTLSLFFVPAFLIAFFLFKKGKEKNKKNIKNLLLFGIIITLIFSPIFVHNYLWFKDKGLVDTYFAQYFFPSIRPVYAAQAGFDSGILFSKFFKGIFIMSEQIFKLDPLITSLAILGIIFSFSLTSKRKYWYFLILFELFGFVFLVLSNWLQTHYTTLIPIFCIFAGFSIDRISKTIHKKSENLTYKKIISIILVLILIFQLYLLFPHISSGTGIGKTRIYVADNLDKNSIVLSDARIYRGITVFLFHDFHYLESNQFPQLLALNNNLSGQDIPTKVYLIECVIDDCGWGTVGSGPLNDSSESIVDIFSSQGSLEKTIYGGGGYGEIRGNPYMKIYSATIPLKPQLIPIIDSTHEWFYYPVNYEPKERIFDNYEVYGPLDNLLFQFAWIIIISSIILAIVFPLILLSKLKKEFK